MDVKLQSMSSYARVPSKSNLSDEASRLKLENLQAQGFVRCKPQYNFLTVAGDGVVACGTKVLVQTAKRMLPTPQFQIDDEKRPSDFHAEAVVFFRSQLWKRFIRV